MPGRISELVLWPGLGNPCSSPGLVQLIDDIELRYEIKVHCIEEGYGGVFGNLDEEVNDACGVLETSLEDAKEVGYIGFSQGGLFLRALLQRCDSLPRGPLVTLGSPHAGVSSWPSCPVTSSSWFCSLAEALLIGDIGMSSFVRKWVVPAAYLYGVSPDAKSPFLETVNSCAEGRHGGLHRLRHKVTKFAAFAFEHEDMLEPPASSWFGVWDGDRVVPREEQMDLSCLENVSFETAVVPGAAHMQLSERYFFHEIIEPYFVDNNEMYQDAFVVT